MLKVVESKELSKELKGEICILYPQIFEKFNCDKFLRKFEFHSKFLLLLAYWNDEPVGFKFGYGQDEDLFYSWTGGVHPDYRKKGIAETLMKKQHEWCKIQGYKRIETRTRNKFPEMIRLNFRHGFKIVGTFQDSDNEPKIILRKELLSQV